MLLWHRATGRRVRRVGAQLLCSLRFDEFEEERLLLAAKQKHKSVEEPSSRWGASFVWRVAACHCQNVAPKVQEAGGWKGEKRNKSGVLTHVPDRCSPLVGNTMVRHHGTIWGGLRKGRPRRSVFLWSFGRSSGASAAVFFVRWMTRDGVACWPVMGSFVDPRWGCPPPRPAPPHARLPVISAGSERKSNQAGHGQRAWDRMTLEQCPLHLSTCVARNQRGVARRLLTSYCMQPRDCFSVRVLRVCRDPPSCRLSLLPQAAIDVGVVLSAHGGRGGGTGEVTRRPGQASRPRKVGDWERRVFTGQGCTHTGAVSRRRAQRNGGGEYFRASHIADCRPFPVIFPVLLSRGLFTEKAPAWRGVHAAFVGKKGHR